MGLGHVAVRDFVSFLKYDTSTANPLAGVAKAYAWGRSQTGRCLRDFVYRGYNADAVGRRVFDGVMPQCRRGRPQVDEPSLCQPNRFLVASNTRIISTSPIRFRSPTPGRWIT